MVVGSEAAIAYDRPRREGVPAGGRYDHDLIAGPCVELFRTRLVDQDLVIAEFIEPEQLSSEGTNIAEPVLALYVKSDDRHPGLGELGASVQDRQDLPYLGHNPVDPVVCHRDAEYEG